MAEAETLERAGADGPPWLSSYPAGIDWAARFEAKPLFALLDAAVARFPEQRYLDFLDKPWTFRQVGRLVDRMARGLQRQGVRRGTKVGLFLPNCPYFVVAFFATLKAGGTVVNYNPLSAEREIAQQIEDSETEIMVTLDLALLLPKLQPLLGRTRLKTIVVGRMADLLPLPKSLLFPLVKRAELAAVPDDRNHVLFTDLLAGRGRLMPVMTDPRGDVAVLQYTGGTTGVPKAAALTHQNLQINAEQIAAWYSGGAPGGERILGVLPLFHCFALSSVMLLSLCVGAEIVLLPRFELRQLLRTITRKRVTVVPGVPTLFTAINNCAELDKHDLSSLRFCISGGAPLPREVKQEFERLAGCRLLEGYGLTEAPVVCCNPIGGREKPGSIGLPLPGTTVEVVSLEDRQTVLPPGQTGEICVRGPQVMGGYWGPSEDVGTRLHGGRLHTGDIGYLDEEGYGYIVDRLKQLIICSGYNVYPRAVEEAIHQHPAVAEVAVCGVPDEYRGETVKAYIVLRAGACLTGAELLAFLADKLSPIQQPKLIEFREQLPKSAIGKILKKELLREHLEGQHAA